MSGAELGGGRVQYDDSGGDGPPLVLCPDRGAARTQFRAQHGELSDVYRVVAWDAGHRSSSPGKADATARELTGELFGLLDQLGIERAVVGGLGHGAEMSLRAALAHPDRVRALVLIDVPPPRGDDRDLVDRLEELPMPVLILGPSASDSASDARALASRLSDCRGVVEIPAGGPDAVRDRAINDAVRTFLESLPA